MADQIPLTDEEKEAILKMAGVLIRTTKHPDGHTVWGAWNNEKYYAASFSSHSHCIWSAFNKLMMESTK